MATTLLSDLVDEYEGSMRSNGYSKNTIRNNIRASRALLAHVGNVQARSVTARHIDSYFAMRQAAGLKGGTLNVELVALRSLFRFAAQRRYVPANSDPTAHRHQFREIKRERLRLPATEFTRLLDAAEHPRDRIIVALGLYLFLRQSEVVALRLGDINLDLGEVHVTVFKSKQTDVMPISVELDAELRRWLTYYATEVGRSLRDDDHLVPAKTPPLFVKGLHPKVNIARSREAARLDPTKAVGRPEHAVQRVLLKFGAPLRDDTGRSLSEGVHTLRRSGARALFDQLVKDGYDGAIRAVQAMLHHSSVTTTEVYLGIHLDKKRRDEAIRGKVMFPVSDENVVKMEAIRGDKARVG